MRTETKLKIVERLLKGLDYLIVLHEETEEYHNGAVIVNADGYEHLGAILGSAIDDRKDILSIIWDAAKRHFSRYEIDQKQFIKEISQ